MDKEKQARSGLEPLKEATNAAALVDVLRYRTREGSPDDRLGENEDTSWSIDGANQTQPVTRTPDSPSSV
jgi:hypothetical protein